MDANIKSNSGVTPLDIAVRKGHEAIAELLKPLARTKQSRQRGGAVEIFSEVEKLKRGMTFLRKMRKRKN